MSRQIGPPILLGVLIKLYDDAIDMKLTSNEVILQSLSSLIVLFITWIAMNDFYLSFACFILALFESGIDTPFWKSLIAVTGVLTVINLFNEPGIIPIILTLLTVGGILLLASIETTLFPEEVSAKKIGIRFLFLIAFIIGACIFDFLPLPEYSKISLYKACMIMIGYLTTSVGTMVFSRSSWKVLPLAQP
jgi:hypothetical protein